MVGEQGAQLVTVHDFLLEQPAGHLLEDATPLAQNAAHLVVGPRQDLFHLGVDSTRLLLAVILAWTIGMSRNADRRSDSKVRRPRVSLMP